MWTAINPISTRRTTYLTIDSYLQYTAFFSDFGPFDIADIFRFCCLMKERLEVKQDALTTLTLITYFIFFLSSSIRNYGLSLSVRAMWRKEGDS
jgi:hypothetical protein